ncbi:DUF3054 domain-containing protein [Hoyosella rhizosphaerae]|uniref:Membrane protein n=1 Tax=Hoyosella rhizosphaerae TaxID=1755582 RepID=A0A916U7V5_9ACTN|nr:DUF3054 domain-containing protein [Hoyosella rhizosphaerae]MBN4927659.1 DUF3054 domain-containing protein [Hoyosella rhizosphaerae]GGC62704.1 membrane protein [Hoyosella rhizosphaerae]
MNSPRAVTLAVVIDVIAVVAFAIAGRMHHNEAATVFGVAETAWPFLIGLAAGWITVLKALQVSNVFAIVPAGIAVWAWTMIGGVVIRFLTEAGTAWAFILTATLITGVLLLGWRLVALLILRLRTPRSV